ncbi:hypothetical protein [Sphingobium sp. TCM1]|uniref:hypothetical protein n=1 Tax=Sphingobium sp. TCM1 TaxID=453246 RepID=UPI0007F481A2|nr:hypothetical protein [Sphingobium sp. TCM1]OAN54213.1 hypothetical protein A7Q26_24275 [Sphingobium sp. TCM1]
MARRTNHQFLAPMEEAELERCLKLIYADRLPGNLYRLLAEDLSLDLEQIISWGGPLMPVPAEVACGIRVRAATVSGELPEAQETVLALMNVRLVVRWISERASRNDLAKVFTELGRLFHDRPRESQS